MALKGNIENIIQEEMALAEDTISLLHRLQDFDARFQLEGVYEAVAPGDGEVELTLRFPHLTQSDVGNGRAALLAVITALGSPINGELASLYKMRG